MSSIRSIDRTLSIINILSKEPKGLGVTEIHYKSQLPTTTIHRILTSLLQHNVVIKDSESDRYMLGMYLVHIASSILDNVDLRKLVRPYLEKLGKRTGEVVHLCVAENNEVAYIDKVESIHKIRIASQIGYRALMHCTGVGKALLSGMSEEEVMQVVKNKGLKAFTENTITCPDALLEHLKKIREQDYAIDELEHEEGIRCIAAPIRDYKGKVIAAISIAGPIERVTRERTDNELKDYILESTKDISTQLGYSK